MQNLFSLELLSTSCHYTSLDKFYNLNVWIVPASLYSKVSAIFAMQPVHLYEEKFVFSITARYVVHMLKLHASFAKFYNLNVLIVPASLYSKVREIFWLFGLYIFMGRNLFSV